MEIIDVYTELNTHMLEGVMLHSQLCDYYAFLGLEGYSYCHKYHFIHEILNYKKINHHFIEHYGQLIPEKDFEDPKIIPTSWYEHDQKDVDVNTKRNAIKAGMSKWHEWEESTKELYLKLYDECMELGKVLDAHLMLKLIEDVSDELKHIKEITLRLETINYDLTTILLNQNEKKNCYKSKIRKCFR